MSFGTRGFESLSRRLLFMQNSFNKRNVQPVKGLSDEEKGDEIELRRLLQIVSDRGLKTLDLIELDRLRILLQAKDYGDNKKPNKSKAKLLKQINFAFYDSHKTRRFL